MVKAIGYKRLFLCYLTIEYSCITMELSKERVICMEEPKLEIKAKKYTAESAIVSMRIPKDMIRDLDTVAAKTGRTRNEIIAMSLEFALDHMEIREKEK